MYVSCAYAELYGHGPHCLTSDLDRNAALISKDAATFGIEVITKMFHGSSYRWENPENIFIQSSNFTNDLGSFYDDIKQRLSPPSYLVRIDDAFISNSLIYCGSVVSPTLLYETHRPSDRVVTREVHSSAFAEADSTSLADSAYDYLHLGSSGSFNYGHFLVDDLPRVKSAFELMRLNGGRPIKFLMPAYGKQMDSVRTECLSLLLGRSVDIHFYDPNQIYALKNLYFPTPVTHHPNDKSPAAMRYLRKTYLDMSQFDIATSCFGNAPRKIFVARPADYTRSLANFEAVWSCLRKKGFALIDPGRMAFYDQARHFANADIVIGAMGAGMTNSVFSRAGAQISYLAPQGWIEPFFLDLAAVCDHRYRVAYGPTLDSGVEPYLSRFEIPLDLLDAVTEDLGA